MNYELKTLLQDEIRRVSQNMSKMDVGTDEYEIASASYRKLADELMEVERFEHEQMRRGEDQMIDTDLKLKQMKQDNKFQWLNIGLKVVGGIASGALGYYISVKYMDFEREGTMPSMVGKKFIMDLLPKKH